MRLVRKCVYALLLSFMLSFIFLGVNVSKANAENNTISSQNNYPQVFKASDANHDKSSHKASGGHSKLPPISKLWAIPFILMLLSIALFPLFAPDFWHHNYWKISLFVFCVPMVIVSVFFLNDQMRHHTWEEFKNYVSFILLLASLFTISGAIFIRGTLVGKPILNTMILAIGAVLASFMATTGASMLLIRPLIRANQHRSKKVHIIIFFIFIVSNIGGLLTPLGDPPLFLGYLKGVPFTWTFNLAFEWLIACSILLVIFFFWDTMIYNKEVKSGLIKQDPENTAKEPLKIEGSVQFIFLVGVVLSILGQGYITKAFPDITWNKYVIGPQEGSMLLMMILSLLVSGTKSQIRRDNEFTWFPIKEVAVLFAGIFACMVPTLYLLDLHGPELGVTKPWQFYWMSGTLSSFLDNAPTYLVFLELAKSVLGTDVAGVVKEFNLLAAISCGSVFMGANSYIGNAPNFMVKAIAEERGIKMPSFFGYMAYSIGILIPIFILLTFMFFIK